MQCPQPKITEKKITEDQARELAQKYADKNLPGFKVEIPDGYGGGYNTECYQMTANGAYQMFHSVEYSIDVMTKAGDRRNLRVDQFGNVTPFGGPFLVAGPAGPRGPAGPAGAAAPIMKHWASFKSISFDLDKSDIRANEKSDIAEIAAYMRNHPSAKVQINGYADPRGSEAYNQGLSEHRVEAVRQALIKAGVENDRIYTGAFGEWDVTCHENSAACWQQNRRVEVLIGTETASR